MVRDIMRDTTFLRQKSVPATQEDIATGQDLFDTLTAHADGCVGMRANMIGVLKNIIIVDTGDTYLVMYNPVILSAQGSYNTQEGCLSLDGVRPTRRYKKIKVQYQNDKFQTRIKTFTDFTAQIIQHEIDHCNGIII